MQHLRSPAFPGPHSQRLQYCIPTGPKLRALPFRHALLQHARVTQRNTTTCDEIKQNKKWMLRHAWVLDLAAGWQWYLLGPALHPAFTLFVRIASSHVSNLHLITYDGGAHKHVLGIEAACGLERKTRRAHNQVATSKRCAGVVCRH